MTILEELRKYNSVGDKDGIEFFINYLRENNIISYSEISRLVILEKNIIINLKAIINLFKVLGILDKKNELALSEYGKGVLFDSTDKVLAVLINKIIELIIEYEIVKLDDFKFNTKTNSIIINKYCIPFKFALLRNILIDFNVITIMKDGNYRLSSSYEKFLEQKIIDRSRKTSLDELLRIKELQMEQGDLAECFVLQCEQNRFDNKDKKKLVRRISSIDVSAGYDIISFKTSDSSVNDKFIEVKSYKNELHFFWSENEVDKAKLYGHNYYLCLVDISKINDKNYIPLYIENPYDIIFKNEEWIVRSSNYKIEKVQ